MNKSPVFVGAQLNGRSFLSGSIIAWSCRRGFLDLEEPTNQVKVGVIAVMLTIIPARFEFPREMVKN